ncbi:zinc ABC transporter substrate-binding protein [Marinobacteraceae bacterium S3BR75-40.1]
MRLFLLLLLALPAFATAGTTVVTTLHPLALLTAELAAGQVEVKTMMSPNATPHHYQMKPSERRMLAQADLIIWVGPNMEVFLQRLLGQQALATKSLALSEAVSEPEHERPTNDVRADHDHTGSDPHLWLDPGLAPQLAAAIADRLSQLPGVDAAIVQQRLTHFRNQLEASNRKLRQQFARLQQVDLFTYHTAFERFADFYGIPLAGTLTVTPERNPGAQHLAAVRDQLKAAQNACVLTEPQFSSDWWRNLVPGKQLQVVTWDPLAAHIKAAPGSYVQFLEDLGQRVMGCLNGSS